MLDALKALDPVSLDLDLPALLSACQLQEPWLAPLMPAWQTVSDESQMLGSNADIELILKDIGLHAYVFSCANVQADALLRQAAAQLNNVAQRKTFVRTVCESLDVFYEFARVPRMLRFTNEVAAVDRAVRCVAACSQAAPVFDAANHATGLGVVLNLFTPNNVLHAFMSKEMQATFVAVLCEVSVVESLPMMEQLRALVPAATAYCPDNLSAEVTAAQDSMNEFDRDHAMRYRAMLRNLAAASLCALRAMSAAFPAANLGAANAPVDVPYSLDDFRASFEELVQHRKHALALEAVDNGVPQPPKGSESEGRKFVMDQLKRADSAYNIPSQKAGEREFNAWFKKIAGLKVMFELSDNTIVHYATSHLHEGNPILYGWEDIVSKKPDFSLNDFFNHVRTALFSTPTARKKAKQQLLNLHPQTTAYADCHVLVTSVKQIFARMFPSEPTKEPEPMTKHAAVVVFHDFLNKAKDTQFDKRPTDFQRAWADYTPCNLTDLYVKYMMDDKKPDAYLEQVYDALEKARDYHVHMRSIARDQRPQSQSTRQTIVGAAKALGVKPQQLYAMSGSARADPPRSYPDEPVQAPVGSKRRNNDRPGGQGKRVMLPVDRFVRVEAARPAGATVKHMANVLGKPFAGHKQVFETIEALRPKQLPRGVKMPQVCPGCGVPGPGGQHLIGTVDCPLYQSATPDQRAKCDSAWQLRRADRQKHGASVAAASARDNSRADA